LSIPPNGPGGDPDELTTWIRLNIMPTASIIGANIAKTKIENNLRNETMQMLTILMNGATHHTSLNATQANEQPQYKAINKENPNSVELEW